MVICLICVNAVRLQHFVLVDTLLCYSNIIISNRNDAQMFGDMPVMCVSNGKIGCICMVLYTFVSLFCLPNAMR